MTNNTPNHWTKIYFKVSSGLFGLVALFFGGCAMCCGPYDYHYPNFGGIVERSDPVWGRIGSVYSDPGPYGGPSSDYNLKPHDTGKAAEQDDEPNRIERIDDNPDGLTPPEDLINGRRSNETDGDVLPPPANLDDRQRPGPDETTLFRRLRNQSQRSLRRWR